MASRKEKGRRVEPTLVEVNREVCTNSISPQNDTLCTLLKRQPVFRAGRIREFLPQWQEITNDSSILEYVSGVRIDFANNTEPTQVYKRPSVFNCQQHTIVENEIHKLTEKGVIVRSEQETGEFISTIFIRPKKDGSYRMILNLKQFNEFVEYHHFKMDTLEAAISMMKPGCFMASVDLKDAYYTVPIHPAHQTFLKFLFNGVLYQYTSLPNGLASAPRIFTKLLKPVYATLRSMGHLSSGYIDDSYLQGDTYEECHHNIIDTATLLAKLGFYIHPEKSIFRPAQQLTFLGFNLDSVHMTVTPTEEKIQKTSAICRALILNNRPTIRQMAEAIGTVVSIFPGAQYGPLHYRSLEHDKCLALTANKGDYSADMQISKLSIATLQWWVDNAHTVKRPILHDNPHVTIQSDASNLGWGAVLGEQKTGGRWTTLEATYHINVLELYAVFFALKCFCNNMENFHILTQIDNTTAVAYVNNMGGSKSTQLNNLAGEIWEWCITRNIWISAAHIPGKLNTEADEKSRKFSENHEWMLNKRLFREVMSHYPGLNIDMFATRLNKQINEYCSWKADPGCSYVDAFSINWKNHNVYAFPPFSLIPRCLQKISQDKAWGILIAPVWPTQTWFPILLQHLSGQPWILQPQPDLLQHPTYKHPHPLHRKLHLMVCPVSGVSSETLAFQQTLPMFSWHLGGKELRNNTSHTSTNGWHFVVKDKLIVIRQR